MYQFVSHYNRLINILFTEIIFQMHAIYVSWTNAEIENLNWTRDHERTKQISNV